jgi:hypothetical protein
MGNSIHLSLRYFGRALEEAVATGIVGESRVNVSAVFSIFLIIDQFMP